MSTISLPRGKRVTIGSVLKAKNPGKPDYIKFNLALKNGTLKVPGGQLTFSDGQTLSVETVKYQLESLESAAAAGKVDEATYNKRKEDIEKKKSFVIADLVMYIND